LFYDRSIRLLADMDEVERSVAQAEVPSGKIRVSVNVPVGRQLLLPIVPAFREAYPKLSLEISLTDQVIDLLEQRTDVALRSGPLKSLAAHRAQAWRCTDDDRRITGLFSRDTAFQRRRTIWRSTIALASTMPQWRELGR
jgi:DNA-binding transcriptional LysR family regulator